MFDVNIRRLATLVTAKDEATDTLEDVESAGDDTADTLGDVEDQSDDTAESFFDLNVAAAAASGAVLGLGTAGQRTLDSTRQLREEIAIIEGGMYDLDMNITAMATSLSDANFETHDAVRTLDMLAQMGVESEERMMELAQGMDELADANGMATAQIAEGLGPTVRALDGDLESLVENADAFTYAARNSTLSIQDMNSTISRLDFGEMEEMGLEAADLTGILAEFADESGFTGRQLRSNFNQAINQANGDVGRLLDELELGPDAIEEFHQSVDEAGDLTSNMADDVEDTSSLMDEFRVAMTDAQLVMSNYIQPINAAMPAMQGLGTMGLFLSTVNTSRLIPSQVSATAAMVRQRAAAYALVAAHKGVATAKLGAATATGAYTTVIGGLTVAKGAATAATMALWTALGPLGLAILGITAAVVGFIALWRGGYIDAGEMAESATAAVTRALGLGKDAVMAYINIWQTGVGLITGAAGKIRDVIVGFFTGIPGFDIGKDIVSSIADGILGGASLVTDAMGDVWDSVTSFLPSSDAEQGPLSNLTEVGPNFVSTIATGMDRSRPLIRRSTERTVGVIDDYLPHSDAATGPLSNLRSSGASVVYTMSEGMADQSDVFRDTASSVFTMGDVPMSLPGGMSRGTGSPGLSGMSVAFDITQHFTIEGDADADTVRQAASEGTKNAVDETLREFEQLLQREIN